MTANTSDTSKILSKIDQIYTELQDLKHEMLGFKSEMQDFKHEMLGFKSDTEDFRHEMLGFKSDTEDFRHEMLGFKSEMQEFKSEMQDFKRNVEERLFRVEVLEETNAENIQKILEALGVQRKYVLKVPALALTSEEHTSDLRLVRKAIAATSKQVHGHEHRLTRLERPA